MDPKTLTTALVIVMLGAATQQAPVTGVLDTPSLLAWALGSSVCGGVVSLVFMESQTRKQRTTTMSMVYRWVVSVLCGVAGAVLTASYWFEPPYQVDQVAGAAFVFSLSAWWLLRDVWPAVKQPIKDLLVGSLAKFLPKPPGGQS